jgi:hypothetical protein
MKSIRVARLRIGDVEDPVIYAGFAIAAWEKTDQARTLKEFRMSPTMWNLGLDSSTMGHTVDLWCETYEPEDLAMARLSGVLD